MENGCLRRVRQLRRASPVGNSIQPGEEAYIGKMSKAGRSERLCWAHVSCERKIGRLMRTRRETLGPENAGAAAALHFSTAFEAASILGQLGRQMGMSDRRTGNPVFDA